MDILVNVTNQKLKISTNIRSLVAGSRKFVRFVFNTSGDWDGLTTFAQFRQNGKAYNQYLDDEKSAYLPAEIGVGTCTVMLYGTKNETIATTNYLTITIDENNLVTNASSTSITKSLYDQLVAEVASIRTWQGSYQDGIQQESNRLQAIINTKAATSELNRVERDMLQKYQTTNENVSAQTTKINTLEAQMLALENNAQVAGMISSAVQKEMNDYLAAGKLANMSLTDGSISRSKVNTNFEATLKKADTSMQPSVYDKFGAKTDIFQYADARAATIRAEVEPQLKAIDTQLKKGLTVDDRNYADIGASIKGETNRSVDIANSYTDAALVNYKAFTIKLVDELPLTGAPMTFYLVPKAGGTGYDKFWYIKDNDGRYVWDIFGSSTTKVVTSLPQTGDETIDYILKSSTGCLYYKYINGVWNVVAGSQVYVGRTRPALSEANEHTDYYILDQDAGCYAHYRLIGGVFSQIGTAGYTPAQIDGKIGALRTAIDGAQAALDSKITTNAGNINTLQAEVSSIGNLVKDITESETGVNVYYKDGSSKMVPTKDTSVRVDDVNKNESGITISYTDGSTKEIAISGGGGGVATSGSASITRISPSAVTTVYGDPTVIEYSFQAMDSAGDPVGDGVATWYVGNIKKATSPAHQGNNSFDIGKYLSVGANNVKVSISVDTGGDTPTVTTKSWTVNAVNMYAIWEYDDSTVNMSDTVAIRWTPFGNNVEKTTHILVDGVEVATDTTTRSGVMQFVTVNKFPHGHHMVELYLTATVGGREIRSNSIFHDMIFADSGNNTPIIASSISATTMTQHNTLRIPVVIYNPSKLTSDATLSVDGVQVAEWADVDRSVHYWNYTPSTAGSKTLTITCGSSVRTINLTVNPLQINNEEVKGYAFRLKASDIATNDALKAWSSNGVGISFSSNFDWDNGGIQTEEDPEGRVRQFVRVKAGTKAIINYALFGDEPKTAGKSFKIIFKATNSRDYDATFLDCMHDNIGIKLNANGGIVKSRQTEILVQYAEDSYTEFEFDIRSLQEGKPRYLQGYVDGVLTNTKVYPADDNFTQPPVATNPRTMKKIEIGSPDCDIDIYMVKAYETYLSIDNHMSNFIADAPNAQEMVARFDRNDILNDSGEISYEKLAAKSPACRIHLYDIPRMTTAKKDFVNGCHYQQIYGDGEMSDQITADNVQICIQGTSSVEYRDAGANIDAKFTTGFTDGNGVHIDGYSMTPKSIPVNYFNTKVNIASCENTNNMCLAEWYNRFQPYQTKYRRKNPKARDCMELHMGVQFIKDQSHGLFADDNYHMYAICNMGNSKKNLDVFHDKDNPLEMCVEVLDNTMTHCRMLDPSFDKSLFDSKSTPFEFRYPSSPTDAMKEAFAVFVRWMATRNPNAATGEALPGGAVTFAPYTFKGAAGRGEVAAGKKLDGEILAGLTIGTYAGTYTHDTYEYRMARMLSECEDHLVMDSVVYHYVFVEQHTMIDNVCKNTFWGTEDGVHWQLAKNYDNDTADGNDNSGNLTLRYGREGTDLNENSKPIFNANDAVWWRFIHGLEEARATVWRECEKKGVWDAQAYLDFVKSHQDIIPERVYNQDYWYKYLRLYEEIGKDKYLSMLEGGKKTHQRESFVTNNLYYHAGHYIGIACTTSTVSFRPYPPINWVGVEPRPEITLKLYTDGYIVVKIDSNIKQVKAKKGEFKTITFDATDNFGDAVVSIHGANLIQAIDDMSHLYVGPSDFSAATKLRSLRIGSNVSGYKNTGLTSIGFGTNKILEELYIPNCPNATVPLDLSNCQALKVLDIRGSGFTGVTFALGGLLSDARLNAVGALTMRGLRNLVDAKLSIAGYGNLKTLRIEDCPGVDTLSLIQKATKVDRLRMTGVSWLIPDTSLLNRLTAIGGLNESSTSVPYSVLSGRVTISGTVRHQELAQYAEAWSNLAITYDSSKLIDQYVATYVNADGKKLYQTYVDRGSTPPDPSTLGLIPTPTMPSTAQYDFSFAHWDGVSDPMLAPRTITAVYNKTVRTYTVKWRLKAGDTPWEIMTNVPYGACVSPTKGIPANSSEEHTYTYNLFKQWDKSTGYIRGDMDVVAIWDRKNLPPAPDASGNGGKDLSEMSPAEIYGVASSGRVSQYFQTKDHTDIVLGRDFEFSNVPSRVLCENLRLDGTNYIDFDDIKLFGADAPSFTIAIDFRFTNTTTNNTLLSCFVENGMEGFRLRYNAGYPNIQWGDSNSGVGLNFGYQKYRDIVVIRHQKGDNRLYVHASNGTDSMWSDDILSGEMVRSRDTVFDHPLTIGGVKYTGSDIHRYNNGGYIYWCKIWFDDLGADNANELASWYHETIRMEYAGPRVEGGRVTATGRYLLSGDTGMYCNASFVSNSLLVDRLYQMNSSNTNVGGWGESKMNRFLNTRFFKALPVEWQFMIKKVQLPTTEGNMVRNIIYPESKIYLECMTAFWGSGNEPYISEGLPIDYYGAQGSTRIYLFRAKFRGIIIPDDARRYDMGDEPSMISTNSVKAGDIWMHAPGTDFVHIAVPTSEFDLLGWGDTLGRHGTKTVDGAFTWVRAQWFWLRSPGVEYSATFCYVSTNGNTTNSSAGSANGVCPCFSI